jgi:hypothetical protein
MRNAGRFSLTGQVALVLGGSSGTGRQIALGLHPWPLPSAPLFLASGELAPNT